MNQKELAKALGISEPMVSRLKKQGMPVGSVEKAQRWRTRHLDPIRVKGVIAGSVPPIAASPAPAGVHANTADQAVLLVSSLMDVAAKLLRMALLELVADELRAAMRAVPHSHRHQVLFESAVMDALTAGVAAQLEDDGVEEPAAEAAMSDAEADAMGRFWYSAACGEVQIAPFPAG